MYQLFDSMGLQHLTEQAVVLRVLLAMLFGGMLGMERTRKRRAAGFRTHMLVCIGATVVMMTGQFIYENIGGFDPGRLGAQVISGIGFLGAGTILVTGAHQIKGLTTAAALWTSACMGIALGIGFYFGAFVMFVSILMVMTVFDIVQSRYVSRSGYIQLRVIFRSLSDITAFLHFCKEHSFALEDFETLPSPPDTGIVALLLLHSLERKSHDTILSLISGYNGVIAVEKL